METPKRLYKYRSGSIQDISNLASAKLWFSRPSRFNDPFDCAYDIVMPQMSRTDCVEILRRISDGRFTAATLGRFSDDVLREQVGAGLHAAIANGLSAVGGVSCFSAISDNLLMWGHYSNGHQGFCLEFDTSLDPLFAKAKQVIYDDKLPSLGIETFTQLDFGQILKLLLTKAKCWEYEEEWRVLHKDAELLYGYQRQSLTGIYFGAKMPEDQMQMIGALLQRTDTKLYRMRLNKGGFGLFPEFTTFTSIDYRSVSDGKTSSSKA